MRPVSEIAAAAGVSGGEIDRLLKYFETRLGILLIGLVARFGSLQQGEHPIPFCRISW